MRHNSGIIGPRTPANYENASGVHDVMDQMIAKSQGRWSLAKEYLTISPSSPASYNEGSAITFSATLNNYLNGELVYYTINTVGGTVNTSDFTDALVSGSMIVNNNACSVTKTLVFDGTSEVGDSFTFNIREGNTSGPIKLTSGVISINNPTFSVSPSASSVDEGNAVTWNVTTSNVTSGTTLYYTIAGVEAADVVATSGSFSISTNAGSFSTTTIADALTEGAQTMTAQIRVGSTSGTIVATATCVINDTSLNPTISPSATSVDEGGTVTFTITTTGLTNGTTLYWSTNVVSGTLNASDFTDGLLTGSFTVTGNSGSFTRTLTNDSVTEGSESFTISIRTGSVSGTVVATSATITVNDTSLTPTATVTPDVSSLNEGATVNFTVNTTNFAAGTLYWTTQAVTGTIIATDFSDGALSGTVTISGSTGTISRAIANDTKDEGTEVFNISVRLASTSGTIIGTSSNITINDTSTGGGAELVQLMTPSASPVTYTVPTGVTTLTIHMWGGNGGSSNPQLYRLNVLGANPGGAGAYLNGTNTVTAGDVFLVYVGGAGGNATNGTTPGTAGINGGMDGARGSYQGSAPGSYGAGGGGGGYTGIKKNGTWLAIAGGGGGGGHGDGYGNRGYGVGDGGAAGIGSTSGAGVAGSVPSGNRGGNTYANGGGSGGTVGSAPSTGSVALGSTNSLSTYDSGGGGGGGGGANGGNGSQGADAGHPCPGAGGGASIIPAGWSSSYARTYAGAPASNGGVIIIPS